MKTYDVIVIGGGPGGYVAAVRASQLGMTTALVEKEALGGTCLNWGCVPTKSLLRNAEVIDLLSRGHAYGFSIDGLTVDYKTAYERSRSGVQRQTRRLAALMKKAGIDVYKGRARFVTASSVMIDPDGITVEARYIIIATGAKNRAFPGAAFDGEKIISFRRALEMTTLPTSAVIIGAGPIGMEFATIWNRYGVKVTVVELMPRLLPLEDHDISAEVERQFRKSGIVIKTGTPVQTIAPTSNGVDVTIQTDDGSETVSVQTVLVAIGFVSNIDDLELHHAGVATVGGDIEVDEAMRTNVPHIFAIGDVNGKMGLAHVASAQGVIAVDTIGGNAVTALSYADIPRCTYTHPEVASVGLTESQAREKGYDVMIAKSAFIANAKAIALDENSGFAKIVAEATSKKILGVHLVGGHVTELVAGATGVVALQLDAEQWGAVVHPHPSLSEALVEAAHALCGRAIHI